MEALAQELRPLGWFSALSIDARLDSIVEQARNDRIFFEELTSVHCGAVSISPTVLSKAISLPISRSEEHTSELQSLMRISYAVFCLKKNTNQLTLHYNTQPSYTHI